MGVTSNGMLCSGDELGLTSDADGILILPEGTALGAGLTDLYGDTVLDVDVKPNRGDALSIVGLAREVAALTGAALRFPAWEVPETGPAVEDRLSVEVREPRPVPALRRPLGERRDDRSVTGLGPDAPAGGRDAPDQQRRRRQQLRHGRTRQADPHLRCGRGAGRPDRRPASARPANAWRRSITSSGPWTPRHSSSPTRMAPWASPGSWAARPRRSASGPSDVIVESAIFDPVNIRRSAFRYALRSDASLRFEKGQEWRLARIGADRTTRLLTEWAGGTAWRGAVDSAPVEPAPARVAFRPARTNRLLGHGPVGRDPGGAAGTRRASRPLRSPTPTTITVAAGARPLSVSSDDEALDADGADLAARSRRRGGPDRGDRPDPRLRRGAVDPAAHADAVASAPIRSRSGTRSGRRSLAPA